MVPSPPDTQHALRSGLHRQRDRVGELVRRDLADVERRDVRERLPRVIRGTRLGIDEGRDIRARLRH
jgi:hypothetical protein